MAETSPLPPPTITVERQSLAQASISLVVPRLPTFVRRATGKGGLQPPPASGSSSASTSRPTTPPPSYTETVSALLGPMKLSRLLSNPAPATDDSPSADPDSIHWKYANQGLSLLTLSASESEPQGPSTPFSRQLYLHALTYLLRALPDLTDEEATSLSAALPSTLVQVQSQPEDDTISSPDQRHQPLHRPRPWLQRLSAQVTLRLFVLASLLLPLLQSALTTALKLNRTHRLSDRALAGLATGLASLLALLAGLWRMQDGRVARVLEALAGGIVASLSAGVYDGVGEGMAVFGLRDDVPAAGRGWAVQDPPPAQRQGVAGVRARELRKVRSHDTVRVAYGNSPRKGNKREW